MVGQGEPAEPRLKRLVVRPALVHLGFERGELVHGVLQDLLRHRAARQRLAITHDVMAGLIAQRDLRGDLLAGWRRAANCPPTARTARANSAAD